MARCRARRLRARCSASPRCPRRGRRARRSTRRYRRRSHDDPRELAADPRAPERLLRRPAASSPTTRTRLEVVVTDIDGNAVAGVPVDRSTSTACSLGARSRRRASSMDTQHCTLTSAAAPVTCAFQRSRATQTTRTPRPRGSSIAAGARTSRSTTIPRGTRRARRSRCRLTPDRAGYRPGDVAKLDDRVGRRAGDARSCRSRATACSRRSAVELTAASTTVELPIEPAFIANVHVDVDRMAKRRVMLRPGSKMPLPEHAEAVGRSAGVDRERAAGDDGAPELARSSSPARRRRSTSTCMRDGKPVADAEVALIVVDEAILALSARTFEDPLPSFYHAVEDGTSSVSTLGLVARCRRRPRRRARRRLLRASTSIARYESGPAGDCARRRQTARWGHGGRPGGESGIVQARKDFRANAVFSPRLAHRRERPRHADRQDAG